MYDDYAATHAALGHSVLFRHERWPSDPSLADPSGLQLEALRRARRLQAEIRHSRILPVLDFFEEQGEWFTVFCAAPEAETLGELCKSIASGARPRLSLREYLRLSSGLTEALAAIHAKGFVHRTLNLHNVLVDRDGTALISDMGCAASASEDPAVYRAARMFMTPFTVSPEQLTEDAPLTAAVDIWALGVILYFLRYQRHPFAWEARTLPETLAAVAARELTFPEPSATEPADGDGPERWIRGWLARLLRKEAGERYHDAGEVHRDLKAIVAK